MGHINTEGMNLAGLPPPALINSSIAITSQAWLITMPGVVVKALDILLLSGNVRNPHTGISQSVLHFCEVILFPQISGIGWLLLFPHLVWNSDQFGHCAALRRA